MGAVRPQPQEIPVIDRDGSSPSRVSLRCAPAFVFRSRAAGRSDCEPTWTAVGLTEAEGFGPPPTRNRIADTPGPGAIHPSRLLHLLRGRRRTSFERGKVASLDVAGWQEAAGFNSGDLLPERRLGRVARDVDAHAVQRWRWMTSAAIRRSISRRWVGWSPACFRHQPADGRVSKARAACRASRAGSSPTLPSMKPPSLSVRPTR